MGPQLSWAVTQDTEQWAVVAQICQWKMFNCRTNKCLWPSRNNFPKVELVLTHASAAEKLLSTLIAAYHATAAFPVRENSGEEPGMNKQLYCIVGYKTSFYERGK